MSTVAEKIRTNVQKDPRLQATGIADPEGRSPERAIKMHEFLMTGGIKAGEHEGQITYSEPIDHHDPQWGIMCPWHGGNCAAWLEIVAGRGHWTAMQDELKLLEQAVETYRAINSEFWEAENAKLEQLREKLEMQPRDAKALRERTPAMISEERAAADFKKESSKRKFADAAAAAQKAARDIRAKIDKNSPLWVLKNADGETTHTYCDTHKPESDGGDWSRIPRAKGECDECAFEAAAPVPVNAITDPEFHSRVYAPSGPKSGGNPWDRPSSKPEFGQGQGFGNRGYSKYEPEPKNELADDATAAFAEEEIPDEIIIEGNEEDED